MTSPVKLRMNSFCMGALLASRLRKHMNEISSESLPLLYLQHENERKGGHAYSFNFIMTYTFGKLKQPTQLLPLYTPRIAEN